MKQVILTRGLPASGKSHWTREQLGDYPGRYKRICKDDLRAMLDDKRYSQATEKFVLAVRDMLILQALEAGFHVIVDDTNLNPLHEMHIRALVKDKAVVRIQDFPTFPLETCLERDRGRAGYVGEQVIRHMHRQYLVPQVSPLPYDGNLPLALICDIDGTLALRGERGPYEFERCLEDAPNNPVVSMVYTLTSVTTRPRSELILMTGREERFRELTRQWLSQQVLPYKKLLMRKDGDTRKDAIVKRELYAENVLGQYNVRMVFDDRNQMVDLWRSLGLPCLQVADGDF